MDILVVIDMQNDFITGALKTKDGEGLLKEVAKKVKDFKSSKCDCQGAFRYDGDRRDRVFQRISQCAAAHWDHEGATYSFVSRRSSGIGISRYRRRYRHGLHFLRPARDAVGRCFHLVTVVGIFCHDLCRRFFEGIPAEGGGHTALRYYFRGLFGRAAVEFFFL